MNKKLLSLIFLVLLLQNFVFLVKSTSTQPAAAAVGRYILQEDRCWFVYNKTVQQLRNEGYDVTGDLGWLLYVNYTRLDYALKCTIKELSWPNVTLENMEGEHDLNVTAHRIMADGGIGEKLASFLKPDQSSRIGNVWKSHDPYLGVMFNPSAFTVGNRFFIDSSEYEVNRTEVLTNTPWGQNETYVIRNDFSNTSLRYNFTMWADAESGIVLKETCKTRASMYIHSEEMKTIETGIAANNSVIWLQWWFWLLVAAIAAVVVILVVAFYLSKKRKPETPTPPVMK